MILIPGHVYCSKCFDMILVHGTKGELPDPLKDKPHHTIKLQNFTLYIGPCERCGHFDSHFETLTDSPLGAPGALVVNSPAKEPAP